MLWVAVVLTVVSGLQYAFDGRKVVGRDGVVLEGRAGAM